MLTPRLCPAMPQLSPQSADADRASTDLAGSHRFYKTRLARCVALEDRLHAIVALRSRYPSLPALPCPDAGDRVTVHEPPNVADVLDACDEFWTPLEQELAVGLEFECESQADLVRVAERIIVIDALKDLNLNVELSTLRKEHTLQRLEAKKEFQRKEQEAKERRASASAANGPRSGAEYFHGIEMAPLSGRRLSGEHSLSPAEASQRSIRSVYCPAPDWHAQHVLCGMLPVEQQVPLSRMVYRLSRGNALVRFSSDVHRTVGTSSTIPGAAEPRVVFFIVFLGQHLAKQFRRLCEHSQATLYELPHIAELEEAAREADEKRQRPDFSSLFDRLATEHPPADEEEQKSGPKPGCMETGQHHSPSPSPLCERNPSEIYRIELEHLKRDLAERRIVAAKTARAVESQLRALFMDPSPDAKTGYQWSPLLDWLHVLHVEKVLCTTTLQAQFSRGLVMIEGWVRTAQLKALQEAVRAAARELQGAPTAMLEFNSAHALRAPGMPPTHFPLNKFTSAFQALVSTYGVPRYRELNPALFTITTFPFLFGLMYGDMGHGFALLCVSLVLVAQERKLEQSRARGTINEILLMLFEGRYVLLCMSLWSMYAGLIYNDIFCLPLRLFPSVWNYDMADPEHVQMIPERTGHVYPVGIDPSFQNTVNELAFYNSFKMKLSVIVGVVHMLFGLTLGLVNHAAVRDWIGVCFESIPRLLFLSSLFGYMVLMIIVKWAIDWSARGSPPPNLIQAMIHMVLSPGRVSEEERFYAHQELVQLVLIAVALLSIPVMLCARPCWRRHKHKRTEVPAPPSELVSGSPPAAPIRSASKTKLTNSAHASANNSRAGRLSIDDENGERKENDEPKENGERPEVTSLPTAGVAKTDTPPRASPPSGSPASQLHISCSEENLRRSTSKQPLSPTESFVVPASFAACVAESSAPYSFSDELIHSSIHTIEFALGTVSNTASYLRLWALSLAHQQLSLVFWNKMVLQYGIERGWYFGVIGFACWGAATVSVLLCMDVLECFLHALRLHWVEFNNKFFAADGVEFTPMTFNRDTCTK